MRTGGYTLQQSLTVEAASIAKQAFSLARRRGHAQVTPLHVATVMFASSAGLFRRACLQSHSHPLQSKALELCFNVALNRLPTSTSSPMLPPHHSHLPALSNALVAAFKRAQAHQRRGCAENQQQQQQPILALKIDVEQLVISILDDPSVSRVMREAGFSSTLVKTKVEQAAASASVGIRSYSPVKEYSSKPLILGNWASQTLPTRDFRLSIGKSSHDQQARNDDVMSIISTLTNKMTKNIVIVGECPFTCENVVRGVIDEFDAGNVTGEMRSVQFISVPLYTLRHTSREEFEAKLGELRSLVKSLASRGVVLYLGDIKWVCEFWSKYGEQRMSAAGLAYSPVEHMVMELSRLSTGLGGSGKLWIMGTATFQTYMKCKIGNPSLETLWKLNPITIPVGSLALGLNLESDLNNHVRSKAAVAEGSSTWLMGKARAEQNLACCRDCAANFNKEAQSIARDTHECDSITTNYTNSSLPAWLRQYKEDKRRKNIDDQEDEKMKDLCSKWNSICKSVHKQSHFLEKSSLNFPSASPSSSASVSSNDSKQHLQILLNLQSSFDANNSPKEQNFFVLESEHEPKIENKPVLLSNPNSSPNSASSSEASGKIDLSLPRFEEHNQENLEILSSALEKVAPWQKYAIHDIVSTILECRSKMKKPKKDREDTWLLFVGTDAEGQENVARELSKVVFGSQDNFVNISLCSFSIEGSVDMGNEEVISRKRPRNEEGRSYFERFADAVKENPSRVFFMEDLEQIDYTSQKGFKKAMDSGSFRVGDGESVLLKDAIIIFSAESFSSGVSRACPSAAGNGGDKQRDSVCSLDLNVATDDFEDAGFLSSVDKIVEFKI